MMTSARHFWETEEGKWTGVMSYSILTGVPLCCKVPHRMVEQMWWDRFVEGYHAAVIFSAFSQHY